MQDGSSSNIFIHVDYLSSTLFASAIAAPKASPRDLPVMNMLLAYQCLVILETCQNTSEVVTFVPGR